MADISWGPNAKSAPIPSAPTMTDSQTDVRIARCIPMTSSLECAFPTISAVTMPPVKLMMRKTALKTTELGPSADKGMTPSCPTNSCKEKEGDWYRSVGG